MARLDPTRTGSRDARPRARGAQRVGVVGRGRSWLLVAASLAIASAATTIPRTSIASALSPTAAAVSTATDPARQPHLDAHELSPEPIGSWGVVGVGVTAESPKPRVWDFEEIGNRVFVAGTFTGVRDGSTGPTHSQAYLAAFDRDSGVWIETFRPTFDRTVYALETSPSGTLLVGGEFTTANGQARRGIVELDPTTGAITGGFGGQIDMVSSTETRRVRELLVDGSQLYVAGRFNRWSHGTANTPVYSVARVDATTGTLDTSWNARPAGSGVWDVAIDHARGRVLLAGYFTSVDAQPGTAYLASVSETNGSVTPGLVPFVPNDPTQTWTHSVGVHGDRIYVGGAQRILQVLDAATNQRIGFNTTGVTCSTFEFCAPAVSGGDYQVVEITDDLVLTGCHCFGNVGANVEWQGRTHYSSFTGTRSANDTAIAYNAATAHVIESFAPALKPGFWGTWALQSDTNGCLWVGGDYTESDAGAWVGGFARFCEPIGAVTNAVRYPAGTSSVRVDWGPPTTRPAPNRYAVYLNGSLLEETAAPSYAMSDVDPATLGTIEIEPIDPNGRRGPRTVAVPVDAPPTPPTSPAATTRFAPVAPTRLVDTRDSASSPTGRLSAGQTVVVTLAGRAGIPADATAVALNVTATEAAAPGFLSVTPAGADGSATSNLNLVAGQTVANGVIVPLGPGGRIQITSQGGTHVVLDLAGWFTPATSSSHGRIMPLTPFRLFDTREPASNPTGFVAPGGVVTATVGPLLPPGAAAVVLNVTGTDPTAAGYVTAFPSGTPVPGSSTLNLERPGQTVANMAIVPLGAGGQVSFLSQSGTHLVVDVIGYVSGPSSPTSSTGLYVPITPSRAFDTRTTAVRPRAGATITQQIGGQSGVPADALGVFATVTATESVGAGFVTVWDYGVERPVASTLNLSAVNETRPNVTLARLGTGAQLNVFTQSGAHLLLDIAGYLTRG